MAENSKIEWTDTTWTTITGCTRASSGCDNCYSAAMSKRLAAMGQEKYQGIVGNGHFNGVIKLHEGELTKPLKWKKPRRIFVNSMSDTFHWSVPFEFLDKLFCIMAICPQHTFQVLTKRPERMEEYLTTIGQNCRNIASYERGSILAEWCMKHLTAEQNQQLYKTSSSGWWGQKCMPNVWLGTSVENQETADERIPHLLRCPATVRFLSAEPLLGPIDLNLIPVHERGDFTGDGWTSYTSVLTGRRGTKQGQWVDPKWKIDWLIVGGESGHNARPCNVEWIHNLRDQCKAAGVPCFIKQLGARPRAEVTGRDGLDWPEGTMLSGEDCVPINEFTALATFSLRDKKGGDWAEWPEELRVREFPSVEVSCG